MKKITWRREWQPPRDLGEANLIKMSCNCPKERVNRHLIHGTHICPKNIDSTYFREIRKTDTLLLMIWFELSTHFFFRSPFFPQFPVLWKVQRIVNYLNCETSLITLIPELCGSAKNCELLNCETSLITLIPELCGSEFVGSILKLFSCSLDHSNTLNLSCTRVAHPIISHLRIL
jgi:hypothetical protein